MLGPYNVLDYGAGVMAAFAAALGIYRRGVDGRGQHVHTSLAQTATYQQASFLLDYAGKVWDEPRGPHVLGGGPLQRFYRAADAWFFLGAADQQLPAVRAVTGTRGVAEADLQAALERRFVAEPAEDWVAELTAAGIGAHQVVDLPELMLDPWARAHNLSVVQTVDDVGDVTMPGVAMSFSATPPRIGQAGSRPGEDAAAVLDDIGLADALERLEHAWVLQATDLPSAWGRL